jgi:hypothetical protein
MKPDNGSATPTRKKRKGKLGKKKKKKGTQKLIILVENNHLFQIKFTLRLHKEPKTSQCGIVMGNDMDPRVRSKSD